MNLVHLDIKPDNIFIASLRDPPYEATPLGMEAINEDPKVIAEEMGKQFVYKIGKEENIFGLCGVVSPWAYEKPQILSDCLCFNIPLCLSQG